MTVWSCVPSYIIIVALATIRPRVASYRPVKLDYSSPSSAYSFDATYLLKWIRE